MRKPENKKIDEIGKMLVKAGAMQSREIEEIVANPNLFEGVRQRISLGETEQPTPRRWILRPVTAGFAAVAIVAIAAFGYVTFKSGPAMDVVIAPPVPVPAKTVSVPKSSTPDQIVDAIAPPTVEPMPKHERIASRQTPSVRESRPRRSAEPQQARFVDDFYAVSYAGDPHETERGGRIVRVDIPRSTLFAMGINVPLENESATVKADLLIGSDGVTRAIRVVE